MEGKPYPWNPDAYVEKASYVLRIGNDLVEMLNPAPGERILDLGCGTGDLTLVLQQRGCEVVGVDLNPAMVAKAKEKGVDARVMDGYSMKFEEEFDAVFSNSVLHWMTEDPDRVVQNVARSLKKGGRFVAEFGREGNIQQLLKATSSVLARHGKELPEVWYFPSKENYVKLLESHGFKIEEAMDFTRDTRFPDGPAGWLEIFGSLLFEGLSEALQQQFIKEIAVEMEPLNVDQDGVYLIDIKRLRFRAVKK